MFVRIRNRLTLLYSVLLIVFLVTFIIVTYFVFSYVIFHEHEEAVIKMTEEIASKQSSLLPQRTDGKTDDEYKDRANDIRLGYGDNTFFFIVDRKGKLIIGAYKKDDIRKVLLPNIKTWKPKSKEIRYENVMVKGEKEYFVLSGKKLTKDGKTTGTLYAGMSIKDQHKALTRLLYILVLLAVVFLLLASVFGFFMAGKAMRPIMQAFTRQRQFVADASHELRTPLSVLHASIEVVEAEESNLSPLTAQIIADMKDEAQRMGRLVGDLLTLARADSGAQQLSFVRLDIYTVMAKLVRTFQPLAQKKNIQLNLSGTTSLEIKGDEERITQLLYILIDNAIKYTEAGGNVGLVLNEHRKGSTKKASITITDTGIGMSEEQLRHVFDRFYRADAVRSRKEGGTGLGLAIAKWIVEAHQGTLTVDSKLGVGSTFHIMLPIAEKGTSSK